MKSYIVYVDRKVNLSYEVQAKSEIEATRLYYEGKAGKGEEHHMEDQEVYAEESED